MMPDFAARLERTPPPFRARCHCLGRVSDATKRDLLAALTLLALPSRTDSFGIVLLEAWFYGKPVVAAQAGGLAAVVEDGVNGRLVPFGDVAALSGAITEILDDPEKGARWGAQGQVKANQFTWDTVYNRFRSSLEPFHQEKNE
jgi:glycosyltransferase involved in cell wall biosynthesis